MTTPGPTYIAGHTGLVGSAILRRLEQQGGQQILVRRSSELDLTGQAAVEEFFASQRPSRVYLAAARVGGILANSLRPVEFLAQNLAIELNVIKAAQENGVQKLLFLGSSCIYPRDCRQPIRESELLSGPLEKTNEAYAIAKIAGIKLCDAYRQQCAMSSVSLMPTNLYGPGDNYDLQSSHVLPAMIRKCHLAKLAGAGDMGAMSADERLSGRIPDDLLHGFGVTRLPNGGFQRRNDRDPSIVLWGTGTPRREFLFVDDLADACVFFMQRDIDEQLVNIGVGKDIAIRELAGLVAEIVGFDGPILWDEGKPDGTPRKLLDVTRASNAGWRAATGLSEGIRKTYSAYLARGDASAD